MTDSRTPGARLTLKLQQYLGAERSGSLFNGVQVGDLRPDVVVELNEHARIAIEVHDGTAGTAATTLKLRGYFDHGMREVWLIDTAEQSADLWVTPMFPLQLTDDDVISSALMPGFSLPLPELFN